MRIIGGASWVSRDGSRLLVSERSPVGLEPGEDLVEPAEPVKPNETVVAGI